MTTMTTRSVDTHLGKVGHAIANSTCFACRHYTGTFSHLTGYCRIGAPDWAHDEQQLLSWASSCGRFEAA